MKLFAEQFAHYRQQHTEKLNKIAHYISVPAILLGALILLSWVSISIAGYWHITFAWIGVALLLIYYYFLDIKLAAVMTVILILLTWLCSWIAYPAPTKTSLILFFVLFIGGWILQFVGHSLEKIKPAFLESLAQILLAPIFVVAEVLIAMKLGKYFGLEQPVSPMDQSRHE